MIFFLKILLFAFAGFVLHYWWQSGEFKARALAYVRQYCAEMNLQLLDDSMVIKGYRPCRDINGGWFIRRIYQFEFSSTGHQRYGGFIILNGARMASIEVEAYQVS